MICVSGNRRKDFRRAYYNYLREGRAGGGGGGGGEVIRERLIDQRQFYRYIPCREKQGVLVAPTKTQIQTVNQNLFFLICALQTAPLILL